MSTIPSSYFQARIGEQLLTHFARRNEVRRTTPLFPFSFGTRKVQARNEQLRGNEHLAGSRA